METIDIYLPHRPDEFGGGVFDGAGDRLYRKVVANGCSKWVAVGSCYRALLRVVACLGLTLGSAAAPKPRSSLMRCSVPAK